MLGDYLGVAPSTGSDVPALPVWVDTRTGNPDPFVARVGMAPELTFASWRAARFSLAQIDDPLQAGPGADPDDDRVVNLLEYAFALNPLAADQALFSASFARGATGAFTASYERVRNGSDLVYSWSASADLVNWHAVTPSNVVIITNAARYTESVNSTFVPSTDPHQFYRLGISLKP